MLICINITLFPAAGVSSKKLAGSSIGHYFASRTALGVNIDSSSMQDRRQVCMAWNFGKELFCAWLSYVPAHTIQSGKVRLSQP
jgi:hypothetical protein